MQLLLLSPIIFLIAYLSSKFNNKSKSRRYRNNKTSKVKHNKTATKKVSSDKQQDEIYRNKLHGHYGVVMNKRTDDKGNIFIEAIHVSSKDKNSKRKNIEMKQNINPVKVHRKNILTSQLKSGKISQNEFKEKCQNEKLDSFFIKRIRELPISDYRKYDYAKEKNYELHPDDRKLAQELYQNHVNSKNK